MVTATDLLALANELSVRTDEAALRCAASRAYYAAFVHCRTEAARALGFVPTGLARDHRLLREALAEVRPDTAEFLENLRKERNRADYDVGGRFLRVSAVDACDVADTIMRAFP